MRSKQKGFSSIELLTVVAIILIIAGIVISNLLRSKMATNEESALGSMRTLSIASVTYSKQCGGYPPSLVAVGPPLNGCTTANLVDSVLASGTRSGYTFTYTAGATDANGKVLTYTIKADPTSRGTTGQQSFFTDQSGVIRSNTTGPADVNSTPIA